MNNLFDKIPQDKIELVKQTEAKTQRVLIKQIVPEKNHILFEFDFEKKEVRKAQFNTIYFVGQPNRKEVDGKAGCFYVSALNEKNAWKKIFKLYGVKTVD